MVFIASLEEQALLNYSRVTPEMPFLFMSLNKLKCFFIYVIIIVLNFSNRDVQNLIADIFAVAA